MATYYLAMERTDGTCDEPFHTMTNKAKAMRAAHQLAKKPSFDCVKLYVEDAERNSIASFSLPKWEG